MNILVLGAGGREHAIIQKIVKPEHTVFCMPGNAGMKEAVLVPGDPCSPEAVLDVCRRHAVDFCVVTPDDPLAAGVVDLLSSHGIACFGPTRKAAQMEASKVFAKEFMQKYGIPTARWQAFESTAPALTYIENQPLPIVIKADGLAKGKGVCVAQTYEEARQAVVDMLENGSFGASGRRIVVEECLKGMEVSVLSLVHRNVCVPLMSSMDHKRALDGDLGPNTGGMGVIAPNPYYTKAAEAFCLGEIFEKTVRGMEREGLAFSGCLYFGLMLTPDGPKVLEYNARFGDPETQCVLSLFEGDLLACLLATSDGTLMPDMVKFKDGYAATVVVASGGYPGRFETGKAIEISDGKAHIHMAGVKEADGRLVTGGGRVLNVTRTGESLRAAVERVYQSLDSIRVADGHYRRDIGKQALKALEV